MRLIENYPHPENLPLVASIGVFDGVHIGHRYLINQIKRVASSKGLPSAVITFPVHPRKVLDSDFQPALLCGYDERLAHLSSTGIDYCISLDFTHELSKLSARDFIHQILKQKYHVDTLLIGYDHRFGHNREESFDKYVKYGQEVGIDVIQAEEYPTEYVSSSLIRQLLKDGEINKASELLSYNYTISGHVIKGFQVGRTIGFPTANIQSWERYKVIPALGVYAVCVHIEDKKLGGMLYIGNRPTLQNGKNISVEVNIFDFQGDLYDKPINVEFLEFVRSDAKFESIDKLRIQLFKDQDNVKCILQKYF